MLLLLAAFSVVCNIGVNAAHTTSKLPSWITPCYRDDPKFDACATKNGDAVIARVTQGERKIRLPVMDPLEIVEIQLDSKVTKLGLDIILKNTSVFGLRETRLKNFHMDFKERLISIKMFVPNMVMIGWYTVSGTILVLPITGSGLGNITLKNVFADFNLHYDLEKNPKDGKDHIVVKNDTLDFNTTRVHIKLDNLFNGDKLLGSTMNQLMNDNWKEMVTSIGPLISEALGSLLVQIFNVISEVIPYDDFLPLMPKT